MRWTPRSIKRQEWHRWWAWYPVDDGAERVWLEWVERRHLHGLVWIYCPLPRERGEE